ncbi:MAG: Crp/Fnr family transcriptional regulator [Cyclobacteriaceae bacterium]|nr:Crp/Fnr family transcriptional regulator [Cyclobacteriaceae bacterium]HNP95782.1 Crp/Fnr family transcriptional regulator [Cyclobacteriaceae bacterium]HRW99131.1 Crp/Fnr family transcriptional regulator [Cyclobacteriaceae bacterium]
MDSGRVIKNIEQHVHLTQEEKEYLESVLLPMKVSQNEFIEETGKVTRYFIHVNEGCLMTYYTDNQGNDHVIQFATPGWWTGDLQSFTKAMPSIYSTRALADSSVWLLPKVQMDTLLDQYPVFEKYFRIIFQNSLITHQQRIIRNLSMSAEGRYQYFIDKYPTLEQFVPQKYIASHLGITPEFLSKIRRKLMEK